MTRHLEDWLYNNLGWLLLLASAGVVVMLVWAVRHDEANYQRLMTQCLGDGRKEYECRAMLKSAPPQVVPMPVVIHGGGR